MRTAYFGGERRVEAPVNKGALGSVLEGFDPVNELVGLDPDPVLDLGRLADPALDFAG